MPAGSDCYKGGRAAILSQNFPAYKTIPEAPGGFSWTFVTHDIDAAGRTANVRTIAASGNAMLDRAGRRAVAANRYAAKPRQGCLLYFHRRGDQPIPRPAPFEPAGQAAPEAHCDADLATLRALPVARAFPVNFSRRYLEGYARVSFDVAPWGATGNVQVLVAEPAEAFGIAARNLIHG